MATETITAEEVPSPASVIFSNGYLDEIVETISSKVVTWSSLVGADGLTEEQANAVASLDKELKSSKVEALSKDPSLYAGIFCTIFTKITRVDVLQSVLVLATYLIRSDKAFTAALSSLREICGPLEKLLDSEDEAVRLLAAKVVILLLIATDKPPVPAVQKMLDCSWKLSTCDDYRLKDLAAQSYGAILSVKCTRALFWAKITSYGPPLLEILKSGKGGLQLQYYTVLVFWLLSFELEPAEELNKKCDIIPIILDIMKVAIKEKIIRVSVSLFYNLVTIAPEENIPALLVVSGLPVIKSMAQRKWTDVELEADLVTLSTTLQEAHDSMSTFDEYVSELTSGRLRWSPAHKSIDFWKRNVEQFKEDNWKLLRELAKVIATSSDNTVLAVASNDIGQVITELPEGLKVLQQMGTKTKIMEMMGHPDPDVKYQALKATQVFVARAFA
ncbi:armadillo-type protein [Lipomyces kononenkoae]|uniref:Armadillo-type protein n=1 Tax=Lipomyces kononenkoae TaxID=34357 RepID=A0ACC3ST90_LIPKO